MIKNFNENKNKNKVTDKFLKRVFLLALNHVTRKK
jgi:hypothetical protein